MRFNKNYEIEREREREREFTPWNSLSVAKRLFHWGELKDNFSKIFKTAGLVLVLSTPVFLVADFSKA